MCRVNTRPACEERDRTRRRCVWREKLIYREKYANKVIHTHRSTHVHAMCKNVISNRGSFICLPNVFLSLPFWCAPFFPSFAYHTLPLSSHLSTPPLQPRQGEAGVFIKHLSNTEIILLHIWRNALKENLRKRAWHHASHSVSPCVLKHFEPIS